ncbi:hypothetical protein DTO169C6_7116 [Paecilomyces variotii]|nr:hypothetical protein DTO169C6_7116 [Paecilomyces variotii]
MENMFCSFMSFPDETVNKISVVGEPLPNCEARITAQDCVVETTKINPGKTASAKDIIDFMAQRVAPVNRITGGAVFRKSIPKSPSGKTLRRQLREMAKEKVEGNR